MMQNSEKIPPRVCAISPAELQDRKRCFHAAWRRATERNLGVGHFIVNIVENLGSGNNVVAKTFHELLHDKVLKAERYEDIYRGFLGGIGAGESWLGDVKVPIGLITDTGESGELIPAGIVDVLLLSETHDTAAEFVRRVVGDAEDLEFSKEIMEGVLKLTSHHPGIIGEIFAAKHQHNGSSPRLITLVPVEELPKIMGEILSQAHKCNEDDAAILSVSYLRSKANQAIKGSSQPPES